MWLGLAALAAMAVIVVAVIVAERGNHGAGGKSINSGDSGECICGATLCHCDPVTKGWRAGWGSYQQRPPVETRERALLDRWNLAMSYFATGSEFIDNPEAVAEQLRRRLHMDNERAQREKSTKRRVENGTATA